MVERPVFQLPELPAWPTRLPNAEISINGTYLPKPLDDWMFLYIRCLEEFRPVAIATMGAFQDYMAVAVSSELLVRDQENRVKLAKLKDESWSRWEVALVVTGAVLVGVAGGYIAGQVQ